MNKSGVINRSPASVGPVSHGRIARRASDMDLWLEILETLRPVVGALEPDEIAAVCGVSATRIYQYQSSAVTKLSRAAKSRSLGIEDVRMGLKMGGVDL